MGIHVDTASECSDFRRYRAGGRPQEFDGLAAVVRDSLGGDPMLCVVLRNVAARAADEWNGRVLRGRRKTIRHILEFLKDLENIVGRLIAVGASSRDIRVLETFPHHLDIGFRVAVGCRDLGMSEPCLDRDEILCGREEAALQRCGGTGGVKPASARGSAPRPWRVSPLRRTKCVTPKRVRRFSAFADEDRTSFVESQPSFKAERAKGLREVGGEWHTPLLATFAVE